MRNTERISAQLSVLISEYMRHVGFWSRSSLYYEEKALGVQVDGLLLRGRPISVPESSVHVVSYMSDPFPVRATLSQGCPLSPVLFIMFMDRISRRSQVAEGVRPGDLRILSLRFADAVVFLASSNHYLRPTRSWSEPLFLRTGFWVRKGGSAHVPVSKVLQPQVE